MNQALAVYHCLVEAMLRCFSLGIFTVCHIWAMLAARDVHMHVPVAGSLSRAVAYGICLLLDWYCIHNYIILILAIWATSAQDKLCCYVGLDLFS